MNERNKPTPKQIAYRTLTGLALLAGGFFTGCDNNEEVQYPRQNVIYTGIRRTGRDNWDTFDYNNCTIKSGDEVTLTGDESTVLGEPVTEVIKENGNTCWVQGTLRRITKRTE